jgi:ubiquinone/menaquinone biosynthesis C-methylase UbiE
MKKWSGERLETFISTETTVEHLHRYAIAKELVHGKTVVDIACGEGYGVNILAETALAVIGIDIDEVTILAAINKYKKTNTSFITGSAEQIPCEDKSTDIVVSFETIEHIEAHNKMLFEIKRILKPDGLLIISTPDKKYYSDATGYKNIFHKKELDKGTFRELLHKNFSNVKIYHQYSGEIPFILPEESTMVKIYSGNFKKVKRDKGVFHTYLLALASDNKLPETEESFFKSRDIFFDAGARHIMNSITYKLGNIFLSPLKFIRDVFKKK